MVKKLAIVLALSLLAGSPCVAASAPFTVVSPDGNIAITFELKVNPQPYLPGERAYYRVFYKGREVLGDSAHGARRYLAHQREAGAEILEAGYGVGEGRQHGGLFGSLQELVGNFPAPMSQLATHVLPILAVALAGFIGGADQYSDSTKF